MIFANVPERVEILPTGYSQAQPNTHIPIHVEWYTELMGGLGDALLRVYSHRHCYDSLSSLSPNQKAAVVLMCHNPALAELFKWHPMFISGQLYVFDLGFNTPFHPWENREWRLEHGLPAESPCPAGDRVDKPEIFPSLLDAAILNAMVKPYILLHRSAGSQERDLPHHICQKSIEMAISRGLTVYSIGHSKYLRGSEPGGAVSLLDKLTVPGMIMAVRGAAGVITSHTSVTHVAWGEHRPVFLMYPEWVRDAYVSRGAIGHMVGIARPENDHTLISEFSESRLEKWLQMVKGNLC